MTAELRAAMTEVAVTAAQAIAYSGAGTIEFIVDASEGLRPDRFWFMEMNTRLQVEHPLREMFTGLELVEWQLRVAAGQRLPLTQDEITLNGHAFEARLYAEEAAKGFLPATGTLYHLRFPIAAPAGAEIRVETGVREGDAISPYYDPMIAKLVAHGPDRATALAALSSMLAQTEVAGSTVNTAFLAALAADADFATGDVDTGLIGRKQEALTTVPPPGAGIVAAAALAASGAEDLPTSNDPWSAVTGYAHFHAVPKKVKLKFGDEDIAAGISVKDRRYGVDLSPAMNTGAPTRHHTGAGPGHLPLARWPGHVTVFDGAMSYTFAVPDPLASADETGAGSDSLRAPMPGLVKVVRAAPGERVAKGQPLLILEAMKMEHTIAAPHDGTVAEIAAEGAQVSDGTVLVRFAEEAAG
jgi:3-methylcrotonyl-CoA carboxylase alpha subunit